MTLLKLLLVAIAFVSTTNAFGAHTPVLSGVSNGNKMQMRARVCDLLGKRPNRQARHITFSAKRNKRVQFVNLHKKRYFSEKLGREVRIRISCKAIKTINNKYQGDVDLAAKKFGVDLRKF
eukprot:CAMPEP_0194145144 /NCGR_PEP_ID=MMETSP0152-20130528/15423_1 /TAXON_ID=1049557 /ORGANISM="Thalassiothrix antarctica, Strain L6-D1" /LENGTH=120 /DNA_ID=CAMNT_0038845249 /DNA_START=91 /DNA_END=453 /DNA_ORIENTATION=-